MICLLLIFILFWGWPVGVVHGPGPYWGSVFSGYPAQSELDLEESVKRDELQDKANAEKMRLQPWKNLQRARSTEKLQGYS